MSPCICQTPIQSALPCHALGFECDEPDWPDHRERLRGLGYKQVGTETRRQPMDRHTLRVVSDWIRYDRPGDPWWEESMVVHNKVIDWLRSQ